jgi:hypothetical protein
MKDAYLRWAVATTQRLSTLRRLGRDDDRGELNSSVYWTGAMVLLAAGVASVISGKASAFADGIDFGP